MRISEEILRAAQKQLDADCGIGGKNGKTVTAGNGVMLHRAPRFPAQAYMTDASYGELVRERLKEETGIRPRVYEGTDLFFRGIVCMGRVRILAADEIFDWCVREYGSLKNPEWLCSFDSLRRLDDMLRRHGRRIRDVRLNFLPCETGGGEAVSVPVCASVPVGASGPVRASVPIRAPFPVRWLEAGELAGSRELSAFRHAVCASGLTPDELAVAAVKEGRIVGIAGAASDCDTLWQIGVDVDAGQRGRGAAAVLVGLLKNELLRRGRIPFYATSQSHIVSMDAAVSAGFLPAWSEIYVSASDGKQRKY